jgi:FkbM family methyltransferase
MISLSDSSQKYVGDMPKNTYHQYCFNIYSQNGEDGLLEQLLKELDIQTGYCCEFGASDGISGSNTLHLLESKKFTGLFIEGNKDLFLLCKKNLSEYSNAIVLNEMVTSTNLASLLDSAKFPKEFDILSIDIDSYDYELWKGFESHRPKIVIIEANSYRDPIMEEYFKKPSQDYANFDPLSFEKPDRIQAGVSFLPLVKLGLEKGYIPLAFTGNITFVAKEYLYKLKNFPYKISDDPYDYIDLYTNLVLWDKGNTNWCTNSGLIFNTALRNYYLTFKKKEFDLDWIQKEVTKKGPLVWKGDSKKTLFDPSNYNIPSSIKRIKIDVGLSYCAPHSQVWLDHDKDLFVFGFEPNPDNIQQLYGKEVSNKLGIGNTFHLFPVALSDVNEKKEMDFYAMAEDPGTSSLYQPIDLRLGPVKEKIKVPIYSLTHFFEKFPWDRFPYIEYLKIDAQGSDFNILKGAKHYLSERVVFITAEPENKHYWGCYSNTLENMTDYLEKMGFYLIESPNTQDPTYLNKKFLSLAKDIFIYQKG